MSDAAGIDELERWLRYEFLPRQSDGAMWRGKPPAETALHYLRDLNDRLTRIEEEWE